MAEKKKVDWVTVGAIVGGGAALGVGLLLWLKKEAFAAGQTMYCVFTYDHAGPGGPFIFRVVIGKWYGWYPVGYFDELEGSLQEFEGNVPASDTLETKQTMVTYEIPSILESKKYDVEASIRWPDGTIIDRVVIQDIIEG